ncbi:unnamed protein product [Sphagnum balticum]
MGYNQGIVILEYRVLCVYLRSSAGRLQLIARFGITASEDKQVEGEVEVDLQQGIKGVCIPVDSAALDPGDSAGGEFARRRERGIDGINGGEGGGIFRVSSSFSIPHLCETRKEGPDYELSCAGMQSVRGCSFCSYVCRVLIKLSSCGRRKRESSPVGFFGFASRCMDHGHTHTIDYLRKISPRGEIGSVVGKEEEEVRMSFGSEPRSMSTQYLYLRFSSYL